MSGWGDQLRAPENDADLWEIVRLMVRVLEEMGALQLEIAEEVVTIGRLHMGSLDALQPEPLGEGATPAASDTRAALRAQAHQSRMQSARLIERSHELAARAAQLTQQARMIMRDANRRAD